MKKLVTILISIFIIVFLFLGYVVIKDNRYINKIERRIIKNTNVSTIKYLNKYDKYYIVLDNDYLYVFDKEYTNVLKIEEYLIHENSKNYDIIYQDEEIMYFNENYKNNKLIYRYYNIYTYELIKEIIIPGGE